MFIIYLWDKASGESIASLAEYPGNENFLIRNGRHKYPLLSALCNCDMDLFSDEQLTALHQEVDNLMKDELPAQDVHDYLLSVTAMIERAYSDNKSILFSPF